MKIYTSYFAKLKNLPESIIPVSICAKSPNGYNGCQFKKLAPNWSILSEYKSSLDTNMYTVRFYREILDRLDATVVYNELERLSDGNDIALVCYEKSLDFCHRHLVSEWLSEKIGITILEV